MKDNFCLLKNQKAEILDVPTVAKLLGVCNMTIYRYMKLKDPLPGHKARGKFLFFRNEVEAWLKEKR